MYQLSVQAVRVVHEHTEILEFYLASVFQIQSLEQFPALLLVHRLAQASGNNQQIAGYNISFILPVVFSKQLLQIGIALLLGRVAANDPNEGIKGETAQSLLIALGDEVINSFFGGKEVDIKKCLLQIVGSEHSHLVSIVMIECFLDQDHVSFVQLPCDVQRWDELSLVLNLGLLGLTRACHPLWLFFYDRAHAYSLPTSDWQPAYSFKLLLLFRKGNFISVDQIVDFQHSFLGSRQQDRRYEDWAGFGQDDRRMWQKDQVAPKGDYKNKMNPIILSYIGHIEGRVRSALSQDSKKLVTVGSDDLIMVWDTSDMTRRREVELQNKNNQDYICIEYIQSSKTFVLGTNAGNLWMMNENDLSDCKLLYQSASSTGIKAVKLSRSLKYLAVATGEDRAIVYDLHNSQYYRCSSGHEGYATYAEICYEDRILATLGSDGYTLIYALQPSTINPLQLLHRYQMCHSPSVIPVANLCQHPTQPNHLTYSGATTLQQLMVSPNQAFPQELTKIECVYQIKVQIHEESEIRSVCWFNPNILVLCLQDSVRLWNYVTKTRFHVLNNTPLISVICDATRFYGVGDTGIVYRYENRQSIQFQNEQSKKYLQSLLGEQIKAPSLQEEQPNNRVQHKPKKQAAEPSKSTQLVTKPPQPGIESFYPSHVELQFMFYNQHGCIVKHINNDEQLMELEYHDKSKLRKIKFSSVGKYYCYYALNARCFMYSNLNHVYFEMENNPKWRTGPTTNALVKWDYKIGDIEGVALGNTWAVVACKDCLRIFDLFGNELFTLSHDRMFLALAAYEDILAVAYSAAIPLLQCQIFEVKLYKVSNQSVKLEKKIKMPIKPEHELKSFGFSEEGYLYNQDTSETVRMYCWDSNEWINVYQEDSSKYKLYIQHLENYEIYGFRVEQREGYPTGPTVQPRSLPRKILCSFSELSIAHFNEEENKRLQAMYLRKLKILHEIFRNRRWYKNKYARKQTNPMYKQSEKILSEEEINEQKTDIDIRIVDQLKKILANLETRLSGADLQEAKFQVLGMCHRLAFFPETIIKVNSMVGLNNPLAEYEDLEPMAARSTVFKYNQLSRLGAMADMGWIEGNVD